MVKDRFVIGAKHIPLNKGKFAIVDDDDYPKISKFKWSINSYGYAIRNYSYSAKNIRYKYFKKTDNTIKNQKIIYMHSQIMTIPCGMICDHVNRNKLDNRKSNLRVVTASQNSTNRIKKHNCSIVYKGVSKQDDKYRARICFNGKSFTSSGFSCAIDAAKCYDEMALKYHGEFACTNKMLGLL